MGPSGRPMLLRRYTVLVRYSTRDLSLDEEGRVAVICNLGGTAHPLGRVSRAIARELPPTIRITASLARGMRRQGMAFDKCFKRPTACVRCNRCNVESR